MDAPQGHQITAKPEGLADLINEFAGYSRHSDLAELYALKSVGQTTRTRVTRRATKDLGITRQKTIRRRIRVYPGNRKRKVVRVWGGTMAPVRMVDAGKSRIIAAAPGGAAVFEARMKNGHRGLFYKSEKRSFAPRSARIYDWPKNDLPIQEAFLDVSRVLNDLIPEYSEKVFDERFAKLYWRDFRSRINKKRKPRRSKR